MTSRSGSKVCSFWSCETAGASSALASATGSAVLLCSCVERGFERCLLRVPFVAREDFFGCASSAASVEGEGSSLGDAGCRVVLREVERVRLFVLAGLLREALAALPDLAALTFRAVWTARCLAVATVLSSSAGCAARVYSTGSCGS